MPTVKYSVSAYIADGTTTDYLITWDYLDDDHITVEIDGLSNADPTASHTFTKLNDTTVRVTDGIGGAIAAGKEIQIRRNTPITTRPISFSDGSALLAADLNKNSDYLLYSMQEALDQVDFTVQFQQEAEAFRDETEALRDATQALRTEVGDDTADADAHRVAAALSETNAATSEANSSTSEDNAAASELAAQTAETGAAASAAAALASENAAAASEVASAASEAAAAVSEANAAGSEAGVAADAATATSKAAAAGVSESNALIYKNNAAASASNSEISAVNSANSATASANSAVQASNSENAAATSRNTASTYATNSQVSAVASEASKVAAAASETAAATSEANAATSETNTAASETAAATSETNAAASETAAATSETNAASSATASANSATASATSETNAATSETNAATSSVNAAASEADARTAELGAEGSASAALASQNAAATSEANAATSETNAATSEANALTSREAAEAALDNFDDRYLGAKAIDPATDNDGDALITGALYFNTTDDVMKVYEGSAWAAAYASLSGSLLAANNLSDVASPSAARTNLGLTGNSVLPNDAGYITISEVPANNSINEGDTSVTIVDNGSDGKVVVRVDGADVAEFNDTHMVIPKGTTAQRDPAAAVGTLRYNTTTGFFETFTGSGWGAVATPPSITGITPSNFNGEAGATFTVNGAFFDVDTTAVFKGSDGTEYAAATVTFVNSTQITLTNATNLPVSNEPFRVKVTNGAGLSVESTTTIDAGTVPAFTTAAGSLSSATWTDPISVTVNATDAENTISGYAVTEGNLPTGLSLNATTGAITGTSAAQATTTYTFTIGATDSAGNTNTRQFSIQVLNSAPVWNSPAEGSTQELELDTAGSITLDATDPEGAAVSYSAASLPVGLSISANQIAGTPTTQGNTSFAVAASDGFATSVRNFFINVLDPPSGPEVLLALGAVEISANVYRITTSGLQSVRFKNHTFTAHVIGAGGWSGVDGMGYGNCGGGGGGGGAKAQFSNLTGDFQFQVGAGVGGYTYEYGVDGSREPEYVVQNFSPTAAQTTWFQSEATLYGTGGKVGWYGARNRSMLDPILNLPSGNGGNGGGNIPLIGSSDGGYGGGSNWNPEGTSDSYGPTSSSYGGGGGGEGNATNGGYGNSGALGGQGGRGGVPNGNSYPYAWRQNTAGTLGGGNGGQAKWQTNSETGPYTTVYSSSGVIQFDFN